MSSSVSRVLESINRSLGLLFWIFFINHSKEYISPYIEKWIISIIDINHTRNVIAQLTTYCLKKILHIYNFWWSKLNAGIFFFFFSRKTLSNHSNYDMIIIIFEMETIIPKWSFLIHTKCTKQWIKTIFFESTQVLVLEHYTTILLMLCPSLSNTVKYIMRIQGSNLLCVSRTLHTRSYTM